MTATDLIQQTRREIYLNKILPIKSGIALIATLFPTLIAFKLHKNARLLGTTPFLGVQFTLNQIGKTRLALKIALVAATALFVFQFVFKDRKALASLSILNTLALFRQNAPAKIPATLDKAAEAFRFYRNAKNDILDLAKRTETGKSCFLSEFSDFNMNEWIARPEQEARTLHLAGTLYLEFSQWQKEVINLQRIVNGLPPFPKGDEPTSSEMVDTDTGISPVNKDKTGPGTALFQQILNTRDNKLSSQVD